MTQQPWHRTHLQDNEPKTWTKQQMLALSKAQSLRKTSPRRQDIESCNNHDSAAREVCGV